MLLFSRLLLLLKRADTLRRTCSQKCVSGRVCWRISETYVGIYLAGSMAAAAEGIPVVGDSLAEGIPLAAGILVEGGTIMSKLIGSVCKLLSNLDPTRRKQTHVGSLGLLGRAAVVLLGGHLGLYVRGVSNRKRWTEKMSTWKMDGCP